MINHYSDDPVGVSFVLLLLLLAAHQPLYATVRMLFQKRRDPKKQRRK